MSNYSKTKNMKLFVALYIFMLSLVTIFMLLGCGSNNEKNSVSGRITAGGSGLSGVTVTLTGASMTTTTDANGNYSFSNVPDDTYTVTPSLTGYTFNPPSRTVYLYQEDATDFDFSGSFWGRLAASNFTVFLKGDGTVWAWGSNSNGQLGNGTTTDSSTPVQVSGLSGVTAVAAGSAHAIALKGDGTVWAWGSNSNGQLGNGTTTDSSTPVQVSGLSGVTAVAAGSAYTIALKGDGTVWAWGSNSNGQLGNGTTDSLSPVPVPGL
jgi:Regulator of chromosome condensation (RCC1) repeat/Carboxypeptidase regulatory-like domain